MKLMERAIHRVRRNERNALFADLGIRIGDEICVSLSPGLAATSKVIDLDWSFGGYRRFVDLANGMRIRVGNQATVVGAPTWRKTRG